MDHASSEEEPATTGAYSPGYSRAAEQILAYIAARDLRPGDRLPTESALGLEIGFSKAVTREAIKVLSAMGRVEAHRGRGLFVAQSGLSLLGNDLGHRFRPTNLDDVAMVFEFRRTQEAELARLAATRGTPADIVAIEEAATRFGTAVGAHEDAEFARLDDEFHEAVAKAARNDLLSATRRAAAQLQSQSARFADATRLGEFESAVVEHGAIASAIRIGDVDAAAAAAQAHLDRTDRDYRAALQERLLSDPASGGPGGPPDAGDS